MCVARTRLSAKKWKQIQRPRTRVSAPYGIVTLVCPLGVLSTKVIFPKVLASLRFIPLVPVPWDMYPQEDS